jgi:hypothetical protein
VAAAYIQHLRYPEDYDTWTAERREEFKYHFRYQVSDMMTKLGDLLSADDIAQLLASQIDAAGEQYAKSGDGESHLTVVLGVTYFPSTTHALQ